MMVISETLLRDVFFFTFDEINAKGGVFGKKIELVVVDGVFKWSVRGVVDDDWFDLFVENVIFGVDFVESEEEDVAQ